VRRAGDAERERLNQIFAELCRLESPSGHERRCADWVAAELRSMGLGVEEDDAGEEAESDSGNLLARVAGGDSSSILLCAHLDTVPPLSAGERARSARQPRPCCRLRALPRSR
jgi:tripeptide aminopeptidase